ncbi:hypothetical protein GCM10010358_83000 [Streptomyces minutiscleroticus]|uniref:Lipase n=1 Tax=Streptomyces minutiscleroticus TaxID=68238 RepID=A0A918UB20_9ACTN|nr:hypothetical protein [Streptomyces minutiscleroticus]GGY19728.1 hypothetical protein GCM10010358_83000 [Streptomyces minutiscleroticus]
MNSALLIPSMSSVRAAVAFPLKLAATTLAAIAETAIENSSARCPLASHGPATQPCQVRRPNKADDTPVLLVPGYLSPHAAWDPLLRKLRLDGFHDITCLHYNPFKMGIPDIASLLVSEARNAMQRSGSSGVHLIGYSLGGLAVRYAVQRLGLDDAVLSAVTVATPHHGSLLAHLGVGPAVRQLRSNSPLLSALPDIDASQKVQWFLIGAQSDAVVPLSNATAGQYADSSCIPGCGHLRIMDSPELADAVVSHLKSSTRKQTRAQGAHLRASSEKMACRRGLLSSWADCSEGSTMLGERLSSGT